MILEIVAVSQAGIFEECILTCKKPGCSIAENCAWLVLSNKTSFNLRVPKETRFVEGSGEKTTQFLEVSYILNFVNKPLIKSFFFSSSK